MTTSDSPFLSLCPTNIADVLTSDEVMDIGIRPLWSGMPRIAGPAYPVRCTPGQNLMLHAAIHRAAPGSVIVVQGGDNVFAMAGGNVCAVAKKRGIAGFVVDGVIRDVAEAREHGFPVFARGVSPIPGKKSAMGVLNGPVQCGGVAVAPGDIVVADEEGVVVVPVARKDDVLVRARAKAAKDAAHTLETWEAAHRARIEAALERHGYADLCAEQPAPVSAPLSGHMLMVGGSQQMHPRAARLGLRMSVIFDMATVKRRKNLDAYEHVVGLPATATEDDWVKTARLIHGMDAVDSIGAFNERSEEHAAAIAKALELPYVSPETIRATRRKDVMRQRLRDAGLDSTESRIVVDAAGLVAFGRDAGYPFVVKPVDGRASIGVTIVRTPEDVPSAVACFEDAAKESEMLAESLLVGEEYSVEAFSERGEHRVVCVTQKWKDPVTCVETGHCVPAPLADATREAITELVTRVLDALDMHTGPSHTEVIVTDNGPRIVETHTRLAGDKIIDLIQAVTGVDLENLWVKQAAGQRVLDDVPVQLHRFAAISFVTPNAAGTLERVDGTAEASAAPGVVDVEVLRDPGDELDGARDSNTRGASAMAIGNTAEQAMSRARGAAEQLRFVVACRGS